MIRPRHARRRGGGGGGGGGEGGRRGGAEKEGNAFCCVRASYASSEIARMCLVVNAVARIQGCAARFVRGNWGGAVVAWERQRRNATFGGCLQLIPNVLLAGDHPRGGVGNKGGGVT
eukprot:COSAG01_NODE_9275_length_2496_cov_1.895286_7_plen_117_part_00